jgi:hypothetical protein
MTRATVKNPPPVLGTSRVLWYARLTGSAQYSGHSGVFVDGRELGPVPALAICGDLEEDTVFLLHCSRSWAVLGVAAYASVSDAKRRASRTYSGVEGLWRKTAHSRSSARAYLNDVIWSGSRCGFCGRRPYQVHAWVERRGVSICDGCVAELHALMRESSGAG